MCVFKPVSICYHIVGKIEKPPSEHFETIKAIWKIWKIPFKCYMWLLSFGHGIGDWSKTSWRNFVRIFSKVLLKTLIDIVPSYNNEIIHVFIVLLNYCLPKHLLTIAKSFAIVFKIPATPIHCSLTFQPSFVLQSTIGGSNIFLMDMNYHYWIHPYQFCIQRTKNSIKNISILNTLLSTNTFLSN